jgi:hypothetical protein
MWEHEAWVAYEEKQPSQQEPKKRNREGDTGKEVLQGVQADAVSCRCLKTLPPP